MQASHSHSFEDFLNCSPKDAIFIGCVSLEIGFFNASNTLPVLSCGVGPIAIPVDLLEGEIAGLTKVEQEF